MQPGHVVIVGASLGGLRTLQSLRQHGFDGRVTIVGSEPHLPYDRPPLSKSFLTSNDEPDVELIGRQALAELGAYFELGVAAEALDAAAHRVVLGDGDELAYDSLVIATGSTPRRLPAADGIAGIHALRTVDDARAIRSDMSSARRMVIVGAGFIGCEIAASARRRGLDVTIVEALDQPLVRGLGPELGAVAAGWYRSRGVELHLDTGVVGFVSAPVPGASEPVPSAPVSGVPLVERVDESGTAVQDAPTRSADPSRVGESASELRHAPTRPADPERVGESASELRHTPTRRVTGVELSSGEVIGADVVVVGIGVIPNTGWLDGSGVTVDNGVVCDEFLTAVGVEDVWAVGDVARWTHPHLGSVRLEHWTSTAESADRAAINLLAAAAGESPTPHAPVPYVWSDQFDTKIQIAGHIGPDDTIEVVWGSTDFTADTDPRFVALGHREGHVTGVVGFSRPRQVVLTQMAMERGPLTVDEARQIIG